MGIITDILKGIPVNAVLRSKLEGWERKYEGLEAENTKLREEIRELKSKVKELTSSDELCEKEVKILIFLSSINQPLTANLIAAELGLSLTKTEYYLKRMWRQYVDSYDYSNKRPSEYCLAQKGREYLVKNDLIE